MWTTDKLREVAEARAEMSPMSPMVGRALLAFERWKGRTEEDFPRDEAKRDLDDSLDRLEPDSIPGERPGEFNGWGELRRYAEERLMQVRESDRSPVAKAIDTIVDAAMGLVTAKKDKGEDRER